MSIILHLPKISDQMAQFEEKTIAEHREIICREYSQKLQTTIDEEYRKLVRTVQKCEKCYHKLYKHSKTPPIDILTLSGNTSIALPRLRCSNRECKNMLVIGGMLIPSGKISAILAEKICDLCTRLPFEQASICLQIQHNIEISAPSIHRLFQKEGEHVEDITKKHCNNLYKTGLVPPIYRDMTDKTLYVGIDGGFIKGWKDNPSFEAKAVTFSTGARYYKTASGKQYGVLQNRLGYATNATGEDFCKLASTLAIEHGSLDAKLVIVITDGANWIINGVKYWMPEAIHLLDMFHLKNKIYRLFLHSAEGEDKELRDEAIVAANEYNPEMILRALTRYFPENESKRKECRKLIYYVRRNKQHILNHLDQRIHGSGMIEKGVDLMISRRLKCRQMGWTKAGSETMLKFKTMQYNEQWDEYWSRRKGSLTLKA